jgi:malonate decarboxylase epsilon subunit
VKTAFLFPGQGAQEPGMLHALPDHPAVATTLAEADAVLGERLLDLDTREALASNRCVQLCLLAAGVACVRFLAAQGCEPDLLMGLSIGAYPAAVAAGALDFADALRLVDLRGRLMEEAFPAGYGMVAIQGLDRYRVEALVQEVHRPQSPVFLANLNSADQMVISGADAALERVARLALAQHARKTTRLAVRVPSHCPLFQAAAEEMGRAFASVSLRRPALIYLSASAARVLYDPARIAEDLATNMARQVHWHDAATLAAERGMGLAVEMRPGAVLTPLTQSVLGGAGEALAMQNVRLDTILALARRARQAAD